MQRSADSTFDPAKVREQCARVLADPQFSHSKRSSDLLKYIVEHTLDGQHDCLKERIIGIEVLGRSPDYDTSHDASVRAAITEVRKRLNRYFDDPEHPYELRIELPAGSYVAEFHLPPQDSPAPHSSPRLRTALYRHAWIFVAVVVAVLASLWGAAALRPTPAIDKFWAPVFKSQGPVTISLGSPATSVAPAPSNANGAASDKISLDNFIAQQSDYPVSEIKASSAINSFLARHGKQSVERLAQTTTLEELRGAPVIVLGSYLNQWAMRLGSGLRYQFRQDDGGLLHYIVDTSNPKLRWALRSDTPYKKVASEYALITRKLDTTSGQWWVGIGGTTVLGTLAAEQLVLDPGAMATLSSQLPADWERKNLQIVIEFKMVDGSLGASHLLGAYSW